MTRTPRVSRVIAIALAGSLLGQSPKPTADEQQTATQIAVLPVDRAPAALKELPEAQITAGLVKALETMSAAEQNKAEAERLARLALQVADRSGLVEREASAEFVLAKALARQGNYDDAIESFGRSLDKYRQSGGAPNSIISVLGSRAISREHLGDLEGALDDTRQALDLARQTGDAVSQARQLNTTGNVYKEMGEFRRALEAYQQSLKLAREKNEKLGEAFVLNNISGVYELQGDYRLAADYAVRSLRIKEALGKTPETITNLINLGEDYNHLGRTAEALRSLDKALRIAREFGDRLRIGQALKTMASIDFDHHRYDRGFARLEEARLILRQAGERLEDVAVLSDIAQARLDLHQYAEAAQVAQQARDLARQTAGTVVLEQAALILGQAYHGLGKPAEARLALGESIAALEELRENVGGAESEREIYFSGHTDAYSELLSIEMNDRNGERAFHLAEQSKGRALLDLLREGRMELDRVLTDAERRQELGLRVRLTNLRAQRAEAGDPNQPDTRSRGHELEARIDKARLELSAFRSALYAAHPELRTARGDVPAITLAEAGQLLPNANVALLEYALTARHTYLFVVMHGPSGLVLRTHVLPVGRHMLEAAVARFREQIASRDPGFVDAARKLYGWLVLPAAQELAGKTSLVIVPDGELWRLPFQALQTAGGRFLAQETALTYAPSLSVMHALLASGATAPGKPRLLMVLANPSGDAPESDREAQAIGTLYGAPNAHVWRGRAASSDIFRAQAGRFDVLHVAAHGVFDDRNPMMSHIILAPPAKGSREDGWLEAGEVRSMHLKPALVVLSGCETARGHFENGEGAVGLSWAFLAAGARATVASQWRVESASTSTLMVAFHQALLQGAGGAEALRRASLALRASEQFHHPFYWAGFELLGAW